MSKTAVCTDSFCTRSSASSSVASRSYPDLMADGLVAGYVLAAAVDAQPPQGDDVEGDDQQGPERVGREEHHLRDGVEPDQDHRGPAGYLVAGHYPGRHEQLQDADDEHGPAPGAHVADHVVRAGDEEVRFGDRDDAVDQVEEPEHQQEDGREDNGAVAFAHPPGVLGRCRCHGDLTARAGILTPPACSRRRRSVITHGRVMTLRRPPSRLKTHGLPSSKERGGRTWRWECIRKLAGCAR